MNLIIKTKKLEVSNSEMVFIEKRMGKIQRFIKVLGQAESLNGKGKNLSELFVEVKKETNKHKKGDIFNTEIILSLPGKKIVASAIGEDIKKSVMKARSELEKEIAKYKTKKVEAPRRKIRRSNAKNQT